ncbi:MAG: FHA domain-containing protein, partial [Kineosporiaceae bacterium]
APAAAPPSGDAPSSLDLDAAPPPMPAPSPAAQECPNCAASNLPDALFCEDCGYDFTTGQMPRPLTPPDVAGAGSGSGSSNAGAMLQPPPTAPADPQLPPAAQAPAGVEWVVEIWVDPDWHAAQDVDDPCPSAGMPVVVPLHLRSVLIGRTSSSRNIHPEVDVVGDTGVSRRHAQLTTDGQRWWVEDLQSANGTYLGAAGQPLPADPIAAGTRVELPDDGRIYVGAWTRLVVRKASPSEATL